jgi:beta-lactamase class A
MLWYILPGMKNKRSFSALRLISLVCLLLAIILVAIQLVRFSRVRANLPIGLHIGGIPVGGMNRQQASQQINQNYSRPVELVYSNNTIMMLPSVADFQIEMEKLLAIADQQRINKPFWSEFWDYLWGRTTLPGNIPLSSSTSETQLKTFLNDISVRYDQPPVPAQPIPGSVNFESGKTGTSLDIDGSILLIENALKNLDDRKVELPIKRTSPSRPSFGNLEILLQQAIKVSEFDGLVGLYLLDLQTAQEIHFAYQNGDLLPVEPDIAFTASSIIKIPIMLSIYQKIDDPDQETLKLLEDMIDLSGNEAADWLMNRVLDKGYGPIQVSDNMKALSLENTFLAGYFSLGSPLLAAYSTPANNRTDINTDPDPYSQTTSSDMGMLLVDLYQCAENNGGALRSTFKGNITQKECQNMIDYLIKNRLPSLLTAGIPEGTEIAHKHGWVSTNGIINTIGDAGIIFSPGGDYVLVIFLHHPDQLVWDPASTLIAIMSQAVYNYYNIPTQ